MSIKKIIFSSVFGLLFLLLFSHFQSETTVFPALSGVPSAKFSRVPAEDDGNEAQPQITPAVLATDDTTDGRFGAWLSSEAQKMNSQVTDGKALEAELKQIAAQFLPRHLHFLAKKASDIHVAMNERILSSYLLGLSGAANDSLMDLASRTIDNPGPHEPHSIDEMNAAKERALRLMAIDGIVNSDADFSEKIKSLEILISQITDATVLKYALRKLDELKGQL